MLHGLKILAFMAMLFTFSNYNLELEAALEWMDKGSGGTFERLITVLYEQFELQPFLTTTPLFGWIGKTDVFGESLVTLPSGSMMKGNKTTIATIYRNIRYAQPPTGNLR